MQAGDLVKVHWGNCNWEGEEDVDWGYVVGVVTGEIRWWNEDVVDRPPCGDVDVLVHGEITSYNIGRLDLGNEVDDGSW